MQNGRGRSRRINLVAGGSRPPAPAGRSWETEDSGTQDKVGAWPGEMGAAAPLAMAEKEAPSCRGTGRSVEVARGGAIDDAVAESVLAEVAVKGEDRPKAFGVDQGEGCAVREAEVLVRVANEDALCLGLDGRRDKDQPNAGGFQGAQERDCAGVIRTGPDERTRLVHDVVRGERLGATSFEASGDIAGRWMERIVTVQEELRPASSSRTGSHRDAAPDRPHRSQTFPPVREGARCGYGTLPTTTTWCPFHLQPVHAAARPASGGQVRDRDYVADPETSRLRVRAARGQGT